MPIPEADHLGSPQGTFPQGVKAAVAETNNYKWTPATTDFTIAKADPAIGV